MVALISGGVAIRLLGLDKGIWLDEWNSLDVALAPDITLKASYFHTPPLYFWILRAWIDAGTAANIQSIEAWSRLLSVSISAATMAVLASWLWRLRPPAAWVGILLFATTPIFMRYGNEIRAYGLLLFATVSIFWSIERTTSRPGAIQGPATLCLSLCLAVSSHAVGVFLIPASAFYLIWTLPNWSRHLRIIVPSFALPCACFAYTFLIVMVKSMNQGIQWIPLPDWPHLMATFHRFTGGRLGSILLVTSVAAVLSLFQIWGRDQRRSHASGLMCTGILYCVMLVIFSWIEQPIFLYRTAMPGLLIFLCGVAVAAIEIPATRLRATAFSALIACSIYFSSTWIRNDAYLPVERWREVVAAQQEREGPHDLMAVYPSWSMKLLAFYRPDLNNSGWISIEVNDEPQDAQRVIQAIWSKRIALDPSSRLWLVIRTEVSERNTAPRLLDRLTKSYGPPEIDEQYWNLRLVRYSHPLG